MMRNHDVRTDYTQTPESYKALIIGQKAVLLPFDEQYLALVRKWINQQDLRAGTGTEGPVSNYEHQRWYEHLMADPTQRTYVIGDGVDQNAKPVGLTGLRGLNLRNRAAEYWIYVGEAASRGRGLASEATLLILDFAFDTLALHRVYLHVMANNLPALHLYRKLGFVEEGVAREHAFSHGHYVDVIEFSLLEDEFRKLRSAARSRVRENET